MAEKSKGSTTIPPSPRGGKLLRRSNSDRLRMHAPSSIQVTDPTKSHVEGWKIAIPLLSPLDPAFLPPLDPALLPPLDPAVEFGLKEEEEEVAVVNKSGDEVRWRFWQHPAAPFYYEPVPTNVTPFFLPS